MGYRPHATALVLATGLFRIGPAAAADPIEPDDDRVGQVQTPHPGLAVLEAAALLAGGSVWYWWDTPFNKGDWELHWDRESWKKKIITFDAVRFDYNDFATNALSHTRAGLAFYLVGRGNGLDMASSFALTAVSGAAWEYLVEFREKPSLNDLIVDPVGGLAIGEPFFQLSNFFARGADNGVNRTLAVLFSPASAVTRWADGHHSHTVADTDHLGLPRDVWHRFDLYAGWRNAAFPGEERSETTLGISAELNSHPGFGRPGAVSQWVGPSRMVRAAGSASFASGEIMETTLASDTSLGGFFRQDMVDDGSGGLDGYSLSLGLTTNAEYFSRRRPGRPIDQMGKFGIVGPKTVAVWSHGALRAQVAAEATVDFAIVHSLAIDGPSGPLESAGEKSVLVKKGYYYAYGLSVDGRASVGYRAWDIGLDGVFDTFVSIEGFDRLQEQVTNDAALTDRRFVNRVWTSFHPTRSYVEFTFALERIRRSGTMAVFPVALAEHVVERRVMLALSLLF